MRHARPYETETKLRIWPRVLSAVIPQYTGRHDNLVTNVIDESKGEPIYTCGSTSLTPAARGRVTPVNRKAVICNGKRHPDFCSRLGLRLLNIGGLLNKGSFTFCLFRIKPKYPLSSCIVCFVFCLIDAFATERRAIKIKLKLYSMLKKQL